MYYTSGCHLIFIITPSRFYKPILKVALVVAIKFVAQQIFFASVAKELNVFSLFFAVVPQSNY